MIISVSFHLMFISIFMLLMVILRQWMDIKKLEKNQKPLTLEERRERALSYDFSDPIT